MLRSLAATLVIAASAANAQVTSYQTDSPAVVKGDAHKIVCKKVEKIGSRLAAKKVCLTVKEWTARAHEDRNETHRVQTGARVCERIDCS